MDWKTIGNITAFIGVLVGMFMMSYQINGRFDRLQAGTNARFDTMFDRMDRLQSAISTLDGRVSRIDGWIEGRFDSQSAEADEESEQP